MFDDELLHFDKPECDLETLAIKLGRFFNLSVQ